MSNKMMGHNQPPLIIEDFLILDKDRNRWSNRAEAII